jgi:membrane dipeptidase
MQGLRNVLGRIERSDGIARRGRIAFSVAHFVVHSATVKPRRNGWWWAVVLTVAVSCKTKGGGRSEDAGMPQASRPSEDEKPDLAAKATELAHRFIIVDGHIDVPWRLEESRGEDGKLTEDVSTRTPKGDFDWERAMQGGLTAPFMSIYVPASFEKGGAKRTAERLIDMVLDLQEKAPLKFRVARSPAEVRANFARRGVMSLLMGMENGSPLEHDLKNVAHFHERGIRYITLAHSKDNHLSDSSYDDTHKNKGLSDFGKKVVAEMNRVGIMVDVSHLSDDAFWQVTKISKTPVIASHSSCRHFTPGWQRNMSDEMIRALAEQGGVIHVNFGSGFVDAESQKQATAQFDELDAILKKQKLDWADKKAKPVIDAYHAEHPRKRATVEQVADHVDHVRQLVGIDHVGLGSDFDGVGDTLPAGLKDVSEYPNLIRVLLERGYTEAEIEKLCSGNSLRVWQAVEDFSRDH